MAIDSGTLKLYRSITIYDNHEAALEALKSLTLSDGQPAVARYYTNEEKDDIRAIFAIESTDAAGTTSKTIFDIEDTNKAIEDVQNKIKNNKYVIDIVDENKEMTSNTTADEADKYTIKHDGDTVTTTEFRTVYHPLSPMTSKMPKAVGDIPKDTTAQELAGRPISQILDDILFETIYPTITAPKATMTITGWPNGTIKKVGVDAPTIANYVFTDDRGKAVISETGYSTDYAGERVKPNGTGCTGTGHAISVANGKLTSPGSYTWQGNITYQDGIDILDSKGKKATKFASGTYENPFISKTYSGATITIYTSYPYYSNGTELANEAAATSASAENGYDLTADATKDLTLKQWTTTTFYVNFPSEAKINNPSIRYCFDVPTGKRLTNSEYYTTAMGWQHLPMDNGTTTTHDSVSYTRYKCNSPALNGSLPCRFTVGNA